MHPKMRAPDGTSSWSTRKIWKAGGAILDKHTTSWQIGGVCRLLRSVFRMRFGILDVVG